MECSDLSPLAGADAQIGILYVTSIAVLELVIPPTCEPFVGNLNTIFSMPENPSSQSQNSRECVEKCADGYAYCYLLL